ncbi:hypothetical protein AB0J86_06135 [Micromonospora sp. NPDC049559]|uniref:hypothetical protein n=1 Tax=Micromonospora sp. NPDC049559 TaxID=3155923 RepID=UPI003415FE9B
MVTGRPAASGSGWRQRWAVRENEIRRQANEAALEAWRRQDAELRRLRSTATSFQGTIDPGLAPWLDLRRDEVVFWAAPEVRVVGVRNAGELPAPDLTRFPYLFESAAPGQLPPGASQVDTGTIAVTSERIAFRGERGRRDWTYDDLTGLLHETSAPLTLLRLGNRAAVSGVLLPEDRAAEFRFQLTLALANATGARPAFVALLDGLIAAHQGLAPAAPVLVSGQQAPLSAALNNRTFAWAAGLVAVVVLGGGFAFASTGSAEEHPIFAGGGRTEVVLPAPVGSELTSPSGGPTPEPSGTPSAATPTPSSTRTVAPTTGAPRTPTGRPVPPPAAPTRTTAAPTTPSRPDLCGAPENPYGYHYCATGSRITDPARDTCRYFPCVDNFNRGNGYLVQCKDGKVSRSGGSPYSCYYHGGERRTVRK